LNKPKIILLAALLLVAFLFKDSIFQMILGERRESDLIIVFDEALTKQDAESISAIITSRLSFVNIKNSKHTHHKDTIRVEIKHKRDLQKAKAILSYQGHLQMSITYSPKKMYPVLRQLHDLYPLDHERLLFEILIPSTKGHDVHEGIDLRDPVIGQCLTKDTAVVSSYFNSPAIQTEMLFHPIFYWSNSITPLDWVELIACDKALFFSENLVTAIQDVSLVKNQNGGHHIQLIFQEKPAVAFREFTHKHSGNYLAIMLDHRMIIPPVVVSKVSNGILSLTTHHDESDIIAGVLSAKKAYAIPVKHIHLP
jgi:hypothetical protein